jgi:anti-anti-sigma factor
MAWRRRTTSVPSASAEDRIDSPAGDGLNELERGSVRTQPDEIGRVQIIALDGEFDMANAGQLDLAVDQGIDAGARDFIADLSDVDFLDGTAIHALLRGWKRAARRNGQFVLVDPPHPIWRVFVLIGLSQTFARFGSRAEARRYLAAVHA